MNYLSSLETPFSPIDKIETNVENIKRHRNYVRIRLRYNQFPLPSWLTEIATSVGAILNEIKSIGETILEEEEKKRLNTGLENWTKRLDTKWKELERTELNAQNVEMKFLSLVGTILQTIENSLAETKLLAKVIKLQGVNTIVSESLLVSELQLFARAVLRRFGQEKAKPPKLAVKGGGKVEEGDENEDLVFR